MSTIREMYKDLPEKDLEFIANYKYKGKTSDEWLDEVKKSQGLDSNGNPKWFEFQAMTEDTVTIAKMKLSRDWPGYESNNTI